MKKTHILASGGICFAAALCALKFMPQIVFDAPEKPASLADVKAIAEKLDEVTKKFNAKGDELAKKAEEAFTEVKNKGGLVDETKAACDRLIVEHTVLTKEKNDIAARMTALEQEVTKRRPDGIEASQTVGERMVSDDKFKEWAKVTASARTKDRYRFAVNASVTSLDFPAVKPGLVAPQMAPPVPRLTQRLFVRDLLTVGQTGAPAIWYARQTGFTNRAAVVSENSLKPSSDITYDTKMVPVTTIAHLFKASKQILDDMPMLRSDVDRELRYGVKYIEEQEILFGDGTGMHLFGIVPQATAYHHEFVVTNHTKIDDIRLAILQSQLARLPASGIVMHYVDWAGVELTKTTTGEYVWANPTRQNGNTLWGLPVVPTEITALQGKLLVGSFREAATLYDREEVNVEISTENNDDFEKNMVTIRCEERVALAVFRPQSFIYGAFVVST